MALASLKHASSSDWLSGHIGSRKRNLRKHNPAVTDGGEDHGDVQMLEVDCTRRNGCAVTPPAEGDTKLKRVGIIFNPCLVSHYRYPHRGKVAVENYILSENGYGWGHRKRARNALNGTHGEHTGDDDRTPVLGACHTDGCHNRAAIVQDGHMVCFACHDEYARERNAAIDLDMNDLNINDVEPVAVNHTCISCGLGAACTNEHDCECLYIEIAGLDIFVCGTQCAYVVLASIAALNGPNGEFTGSDDVGRGGKSGAKNDRKNPAGKGKGKGPRKPKFEYVCKICNIPGHSIWECPDKKDKVPGLCTECEMPGHKAINCPDVAAAQAAEDAIWTARMKTEAIKLDAVEPKPKIYVTRDVNRFRETKVMGDTPAPPVGDRKVDSFIGVLRSVGPSVTAKTLSKAPLNHAVVLARFGGNLMGVAKVGYDAFREKRTPTQVGEHGLPKLAEPPVSSLLQAAIALTGAAPGVVEHVPVLAIEEKDDGGGPVEDAEIAAVASENNVAPLQPAGRITAGVDDIAAVAPVEGAAVEIIPPVAIRAATDPGRNFEPVGNIDPPQATRAVTVGGPDPAPSGQPIIGPLGDNSPLANDTIDVGAATTFYRVENEKLMKRIMTANNIRDKIRALLMTKDLDSKTDRKNVMMLCMNIARKSDGYSNDLDTASVVAEIFEEELPNVIKMRGILATAVRDNDSACLGDLDYLNWLRFKSASFGRKFGIVDVAEQSVAGGGKPSNIAPIAALATVVAETAVVRYIGGVLTRHTLSYVSTYLGAAIKLLSVVVMPLQALETALGIQRPESVDIRVEPGELIEHIGRRAATIGGELYDRLPATGEARYYLPSGAEVRNTIRAGVRYAPERRTIDITPDGCKTLYRIRGFDTHRLENDAEYSARTGCCTVERITRRAYQDAIDWASTDEPVPAREPPTPTVKHANAEPHTLTAAVNKHATGVVTVILPVLLTTIITFSCNWLAAGLFCDFEKWYRPTVDVRTKHVHRFNAATACYGWPGFFAQVALHFGWNTIAGLCNRRELMADVTSSKSIYTKTQWESAKIFDLCLDTYRCKKTPTQSKFKMRPPNNLECVPKFGFTRLFGVDGFSSTVYAGCCHNEEVSLTARVGKNLPIHESQEMAKESLLNGSAWPRKCYLGLLTAEQAKSRGSSKGCPLTNGVATFPRLRRPSCCTSGTHLKMTGSAPHRLLSNVKRLCSKGIMTTAYLYRLMIPRTSRIPE